MHTERKELAARLARVEGQVAALKRSLESSADLDCTKTLTQLKAASSGLKRFGEAFARAHAKDCLLGEKSPARVSRDLDTIITSAFNLS